ncbi:MAG: 50S ribosomal protein L25/general stress protein Ctc [Deltaproteobacteria bacterium]|nr:MAG: 50S ribosomal protein L25/general stress protein Ctc [Deltaproteobacteria bacterium]
METVALNARSRKETGKGVARSLRRQALIPAVFYGPKVEPVPLALGSKEVEKVVSSEAPENILIDLNIENGEATESHRAMIKEIQVDPVKQTILHVDFYAITMDQKISLEIPISLTGTPVGVTEGGILQQVSRTIEVSCLPDQIPETLVLDVSDLVIGDSLHVTDLDIPEGVELLVEEKLTVATVVPPTKEEIIEPEILEEEEGEEVEEEEAVAETKEEGDEE